MGRSAARTSELRATRPASTAPFLRVDPDTGAGLPGNPFYGSTDANARRIIAFGLRNPFRFTFRPGTNEVWIGEVGRGTWEEINRLPDPTDGTAENFGWPCYEGVPRQGGFDGANLDPLREPLQPGPRGRGQPLLHLPPRLSRSSMRTCKFGSPSNVRSRLLPKGPIGPVPGLLTAARCSSRDYPRDCIWAMLPGADGLPDPNHDPAVRAGRGQSR